VINLSASATNESAGLRIVQPADRPAVMGVPWSFEDLLHPVSASQFASEYWGRVPLHVKRGAPDFYSGLISLECVERHVAIRDMFARTDTLYMRGDDFWTRGEQPRTMNAMYERVVRGQSLQVRRLESVLEPSAPMIALVRNMERALQHPRVSIGCYISPPHASGLGPHHDETEIFTLQIAGRKRWRLYHRVHTAEPGIYSRNGLGEPAHDFLLEAGDFFYHPRGWIHDVSSEDVPSFSITIVFRPVMWKTVLEQVVARLLATPDAIEQLPAGVLMTDDAAAALRRPFDERLAAFRERLGRVSLEAVLEDLAAQQASDALVEPDSRFETLFQFHHLTRESVLEYRRDRLVRITDNADGMTLLISGGDRVHVSHSDAGAVRWIVGTDRPFTVGEMSGPDDDQKLALVRRLLTSGLVRPVSGRRWMPA
jgi:ribosomal protein L16 Arg81 hydroxylase